MGNYDRYITPSGKQLNGRTLLMLNEAEYLLGAQIPITQGGWNKGGVAASAGAHDAGGALDFPPRFSGKTPLQIVKALRRVGFAAWHRKAIRGLWPEHIHAVALGDRQLAPVAKNQASAYLDGFDGLGHLGRGGKDDGPRDIIQTWEQYKANHPKRFPKG
jgi:hypothetical protein